MTTRPIWTIAKPVARLAIGRLTAQVDLAKPEQGVCAIAVADVPLTAVQLLGVFAKSGDEPAAVRLDDVYARGQDLVADYSCQPAGLRLRLYWTATCDEESSDVVSLALTASLRTDRLDEEPDVRSHSRLPAEGIQRLDASLAPHPFELTSEPTDAWAQRTIATLFSCPGDLVYAEMPHPDDIQRSTISRSGTDEDIATITHELFTDHLEKGVIVRARVLGLILPQDEQTLGRIAERHQAFAAMEPPLDA